MNLFNKNLGLLIAKMKVAPAYISMQKANPNPWQLLIQNIMADMYNLRYFNYI